MILFGDGAAAAVLARSSGAAGLLAWDLGCDGSAAGAHRDPRRRRTAARVGRDRRGRRPLHEDAGPGSVPARGARHRRLEHARRSSSAGVTVDDVAWFVPHQANLRIIEAAAKRLGFDRERTVTNIERYGNTSSASIPLALFEAVDDGRVRDGDLVLCAGVGAGLTWGSALDPVGRPRERAGPHRSASRSSPARRGASAARSRSRSRAPAIRSASVTAPTLDGARKRRRAPIEAEGAKAVAVQSDVSDPAAVDAAFGEVEAAFGKVTILVNNAGITRDGLVARMSDEQWRTVIDTNLTGAFNTIRRATPGMMRERYGRIVNVASVAGQSGQAGPGQLRRGQSRPARPFAQHRPGARAAPHHLQRGRARTYRDRHDRRHARRVEGSDRERGAAGALRHAGGVRRSGRVLVLGSSRAT